MSLDDLCRLLNARWAEPDGKPYDPPPLEYEDRYVYACDGCKHDMSVPDGLRVATDGRECLSATGCKGRYRATGKMDRVTKDAAYGVVTTP